MNLKNNAIRFIYLLARIFLLSLTGNICFSDEEVKRKSVLIVYQSNSTTCIPKALEKQTHNQIRLIQSLPDFSDIQEDYVFFCHEKYIYTETVVECVLQDMKHYSKLIWKMPLFFFEKEGDAIASASMNANYKFLAKGNMKLKSCMMCHRNLLKEFSRGNIQVSNVYKPGIYTYLYDIYYLTIKDLISDSKIVLFPCGAMGEGFARCLIENGRKEQIVAFVDNDERKQGKCVFEIPVYAIEFLKEVSKFDRVIIAVGIFAKEIYKQVIEIVPKEKILLIDFNNE